MEQCSECFYYSIREIKVDGDCKRYPPTVVREPKTSTGPQRIVEYSPKVSHWDWCGEFKEKPEEKE